MRVLIAGIDYDRTLYEAATWERSDPLQRWVGPYLTTHLSSSAAD